MSRWDSADLKLKKFLRKFDEPKEPEKQRTSFDRNRKYTTVRLPPVAPKVILRPKKATSLEQLQLKYDSGTVNMYVCVAKTERTIKQKEVFIVCMRHKNLLPFL